MPSIENANNRFRGERIVKGKTTAELIEALYYNPEMEILYRGKRYLVSGFVEEDGRYTLRMDSVEPQSRELFCAVSQRRGQCVGAFERAVLFDGRTVYEAEREIEVLFG